MNKCINITPLLFLMILFLVPGCKKEEKNPFLESVQIEQIMAYAKPSATSLEKASEQAGKVLEQLKAGENFSKLAREYSTHSSASEGGELTIASGWMDPAFDEVVMAMEDSSLSGIIQTPEAIYIAYRERGDYLQVRSSHILLSPDQELKDEARERAFKPLEKKAWDLRKRIIEGESFYDLAREYSADPGSAQKGGDIGWQKRNSLVPEYEKVAFSQKLGEISEPVRTRFGWHIIRTVQKKDLSLKLKIIEFKAEITDADKSKARMLLTEVRRQAEAGVPLAQLPERFANSEDVKLEYVGKYPVRKNLMVPELAREIENMEEGDISKILQNEAGFYFVKLLEVE